MSGTLFKIQVVLHLVVRDTGRGNEQKTTSHLVVTWTYTLYQIWTEGESEQLEEFVTHVWSLDTISWRYTWRQLWSTPCAWMWNNRQWWIPCWCIRFGWGIWATGPGCGASSTCTLPVSTDDHPLYDGAPLTVSASGILIMQYKMQHKLTNESVADLLELLSLHCPTPNYCIASMYQVKKQFRFLAHPIQFIIFVVIAFSQLMNSWRCAQIHFVRVT